MNKLSIYDWFGYDLPMKERYRLIKQAGFDGTMVWWGHFEAKPNLEKHQNPNLAREQGLVVENLHAPFNGVNNLWCDTLEGEDYANCLCNCIDDCVLHEVPTMVVHISGGNAPPPVNKIGLDRVRKIVAQAERNGIKIALENLRRPKYLRFLFENIQSDTLKFCFDSGHQNCWTPNEDYLSQYGEKLIALHLHDNEGLKNLEVSEDQHRLPFDGTMDWGKVMQQLKAINYQGSLALEITNFGYENRIHTPEAFLKLSYERAKRLQGLL